jgi:hypothetical protein
VNPRELQQLLDDLIEGRIGAEDFQKLQAELRTNPEARHAYREAVHLEHSLRFRAKGVDLLRVVPMEKVVARRHRRMLRGALYAAAAILVLGVVTMALILTHSPPPTLTFAASSGSEWMIRHTLDDPEAASGREMQPGSKLLLTRGEIELRFASGVRGVIEGPAEVTLRRKDLLDLSHGKVWFHVPPEAKGFQVRTPQLVLTDLGTAFGMISEKDQADEVHVLEGRVEVHHREGLRKQLQLKAGEARKADASGRWREIPLRPRDFLEQLPVRMKRPVRINDSAHFTSSPENQMVKKMVYGFSSETALAGFDPSTSDKLVVSLSHERGSITEVTYGGVRMALAATASDGDLQSTSIYHLDAPGSASDLVIRFGGEAANGVGGSVLAVSNTLPGGPESVVTSRSDQLRLSTDITGSLIVASHAAAEEQGLAAPWSPATMKRLFAGPTGSSQGASGYWVSEISGDQEVDFGTGSSRTTSAAAIFAAKP